MKKNLTALVVAITFFTASAAPDRLVAQEHQEQKKEHRRYRLIDLGTFGGVTSYVNPVGNSGPYMNREGEVVGSSMTSIPSRPNGNPYPCPPAPGVFHAMAWGDDGVTDPGSLREALNCANALAINDAGEIVGASENGLLDPATGVIQIRAVRWNHRQIKNLGTFGGNHSFASAINNRGQIVGFALNKVADPFSLFDRGILGSTNGTQTRAFLWEHGRKRDLDTLGGSDAWATFVNEPGQVAGYSYTNSTPNSTTGVPIADPFLWSEEHGMIDLGTLGGTFGFPVGLNNRGQVIGQSNLAGDQSFDPFLWDGEKLIDMFAAGNGGNFLFANAINDTGEVVGAAAFSNHTFDAAIWRNGVVTDLGALPGDCFSQAFVMNSRRQIAGNSATCDGKLIRAVLWEDGQIFDLNTLVPSGSNFLLVESNVINDRGEIAGNGFPPRCTDFSCTHAYVLIPCDRAHSEPEGCEAEGQATVAAVQSIAVPVDQNWESMAESTLTSREIAARVRPRFGRNRGLGAVRQK
jgi:probable HAF family extracellular repeat protein